MGYIQNIILHSINSEDHSKFKSHRAFKPIQPMQEKTHTDEVGMMVNNEWLNDEFVIPDDCKQKP